LDCSLSVLAYERKMMLSPPKYNGRNLSPAMQCMQAGNEVPGLHLFF